MAYTIDAIQDNCYPGTTVLVNKLGLKDQALLDKAEIVSVSLRAMEIEENPDSSPFTFEYYRSIHHHLFGDIYDWAGELRKTDISKKGTVFYPAEQLERLGRMKFERLQQMNELRGLGKSEFVEQISNLYHELNMLHPFREGNGRTQRLFFTLLVRRAGYNIDFSNCDLDELVIATIFSAQGVRDQLTAFFKKNITG